MLDSGRTTGFDPFSGLSTFVAINFPAMPESIELARSADYLVVNSQVMPDGIHQYKSTNPLNIPFSFSLHAFDKEYCPQGALSLMQTAALLESLNVPLSSAGTRTPLRVTVAQSQPATTPGGSTDAQVNRAQSADNPYSVTPESGTDFYPPVTLRLELIFIDEDKPGIVCTGYVKDVKARLKGPWLRGPGRSSNLPSSGEFEFTFVHVPGYGNNFSITANTAGTDASMAQAFADDIRTKMFNTSDLSLLSDRSYKGFQP